jgi:hypothetical protein
MQENKTNNNNALNNNVKMLRFSKKKFTFTKIPLKIKAYVQKLLFQKHNL